ncbi:Uncharacterised protein [Moellerella wisconsensis]|nr:Uncharacterised protein [Moellerella wisconsensis]
MFKNESSLELSSKKHAKAKKDVLYLDAFIIMYVA